MSLTVDLVICNGRVVDPANGIDHTADVAINEGKILTVAQDLLNQFTAKEVFDASGCLVTPGLIDGHVHVYQHATSLGVNVDECCLSRGVTTVLDAGSAGVANFLGLRKFVAEKCRTRVLALLHISACGLTAFGLEGDLESLTGVDPKGCVECVNQNRDIIVGIKVRLEAANAINGANEEEAFRRALDASGQLGLPLMTHHFESVIPHGGQGLSCPHSLRPGDIYTHCFHGFSSTIVDPATGKIRAVVREARARGVLFDVGHGRDSFSWTVAEICARQGFWPDIISSDVHIQNCRGPVYDLPVVMTKMLHVGMPLYDVIKAVTMTPAAALGRSHVIGSLGANRMADITILKEDAVDVDLEDSKGQIRRVNTRLVPVAVWKDGVQHQITQADPFPNHACVASGLLQDVDRLAIKDGMF